MIERIVARLDACAVPFVALLAPAGFSKTEIAAAYAARFRHAKGVDFKEGMSSSDGRSGLGEDAWGKEGPVCIIVDVAERADDDEVHVLLKALLETRPSDGSIILCSRRESLTLKFTDLIGPDQMAVFRRTDLELTFSEVRSRVPEGVRITYSALYEIYALTRGWPVVVAAILSAYARGAFSDGIRNRHDPALYDVLDWVDKEVVAVLPEPLRQALLRCIACPDTLPADFDGEFGDTDTRPDRCLLRNEQRADLGYAGEIRVHPLIEFAVRARHGEALKTAGLKEIVRLLERGQAMRAVRVAVCIGDLERASEIAASCGFDGIRDLSGFAYPGLALEYHGDTRPPYDRYPLLWLGLLPARLHVISTRELAREGLNLLQARGGKIDARLRRWLGAAVAALFAESGDITAGERLAALIEEREPSDDPDTHIAVDAAQMYLDAARGGYESALDRWSRVGSYFDGSPVWHSLHLRCAARAKAALGDTRAGVDAMRAMLAAIRLGGCPALAAFGAMYAASFSWWSESDADFRFFRREFARLIAQYDAPMLWRCLSAFYGREFDQLTPSPELHDALAALILASDCTDAERGRALAVQAVSVADLGNDIALRVETRFVQAVRNLGPNDKCIDDALALVQQFDSSVLRDSLAAYRTGAFPIGFLQTILDHIRRSGLNEESSHVTDTARIVPASPAERTLVVDVASGDILRGEDVLRTSEGTSQLLMFLAVHHGASREVLTDALWPDFDGDAAANALKACIHRARLQLEDSEAIAVAKSTYRLGASVRSTYQSILDSAAMARPFSEEKRVTSLEVFDRLSKGLAANRLPWQWFVPYANALCDAMRALGGSLGEDALDRGDLHTALQVARRLASVDPLDECGRELALRAYTQLGNRSAALREYEEYREKLRVETGSVPSERLRSLVTIP